MDDDRFLELVARCLAGEADDAEQRAMLAAAEAAPGLRARLIEQVRLDAALRAHSRDVDAFVGRVRATVTAKGRSAAFSAAVRRRFEGERRRFAWHWLSRLWLPGLAIAALVAVGLLAFPRSDDATAAVPPLAVVVEASGGCEVVAGDRRMSAAPGATIAPGDLCRTTMGAWLVVRLADGVMVAARGAAAWSPSAAGLRIDTGAILLSRPIADAQAPFAVSTPTCGITVLGSRCAIATGADGDRIEPLEGSARVVRHADGTTVTARADEAVVAGADGLLEQRPRRVADDLLGLWLFGAGAGTVVRDLSGRAMPLDLTIADPTHATWRPHGLRLDPLAAVTASARADVAPIAARRGLTVECWAVVEAGNTQRLQVLELDSESGFRATGHSLTVDRLCHLVYVVYAHEGRCLVALWRDGEPLGDLHDVGEAALIDRLASETPWLNVATADDPAGAPGIELRLLALYAGALTPEQIQRNHASGLPQSAPLLEPWPRDPR